MSGLRTTILLIVVIATGTLMGAVRKNNTKSNMTIAYIVRHAEKVDESANADLSDEGKERAKLLQWMLRDVSFDAIYSTNAPRTLSTVQPIATSRGMKIASYSPRPGTLSKTIKQQSAGKTILVGGHSNTIPQLLGELGVGIEEDLLQGFDDLFIVTIVRDDHNKIISTTLQRLHYPGSI